MKKTYIAILTAAAGLCSCIEMMDSASQADVVNPLNVSFKVKAVTGFVDADGNGTINTDFPVDGLTVRFTNFEEDAVIETLTDDGARTIMAQRFIPEIADGDKRILIIGGEVVPYCLARIPKAGETRGNLATGGTGVARPLTERDREIAEALAPVFAERGLLFVGIDVIGDWLTEINVTSPTCMVEICDQTGFDAAAMFIAALERECPAIVVPAIPA